MNRLTQGVIMAVIGVMVITATVTGLYLNFVKEVLRIPLVVSAGLLILMGLYQAFASDSGAEEPVSRPGHEVAHDKVSAVGWFLVVPFLIMSVVVPPPLGSYSAERDTGLAASAASDGGWEPLPAEDPVTLTLDEFQSRALFDESESLRGRTIRLVGFVSSVESGEGWAITRLSLNCCAADGYALKVDVIGGQRLPDDTWIEAVGRWVPTPPNEDGSYSLPILEIDSVQQIEAPDNPYE
ncbi:TIGR03943 family protein [Nostocoides sp. F2B08]|uniref:TIGR03943 family putative permease subunit n=1 Tax=Nostocoides sp. F2B08 TaxID=2653936 RepID=UPI0012636E61|nr:TIGR03943 family protein [Tetrasphaera sp. F2B08]KAB7744728.1 TIGR03943 family protein [Tetrasphaera sp. F2B08]